MHEAPAPTPSARPETKVTTATVSGAATTMIIFLAALFGLEVTETVAAAAVTVVMAVAAYVAPHTRRE